VASPARRGGNDRDVVAVFQRGFESLAEPDIFPANVDVDESTDAAVLFAEAFPQAGERLPQIGNAVGNGCHFRPQLCLAIG